MSKRAKERIEELSYLGSDTEMLMPNIYLNADKQATVDGCKGVIEYDSKIVRLNCGRLILKFCGDNLTIKAVSTREISVTGQIISVEFLT